MSNRKPHLLKVKQSIVYLIDGEIELMKEKLSQKEPGFEKEDAVIRRELAIWIRQRNKIAKDADIKPIEVSNRDGQGKIIY